MDKTKALAILEKLIDQEDLNEWGSASQFFCDRMCKAE